MHAARQRVKFLNFALEHTSAIYVSSPIQKTTWCHNPTDNDLCSHWYENCKSCI